MRGIRKEDKLLATAGGFTGLWALTWLGSSMMGAPGVAQGAFGVGAVMGGSGLTAMWWKARQLDRYREDAEAEDDSHVGRAQKG